MHYAPSAPLSPCVKICVMDPLSGFCIGCGRTVAEISLWPEMSHDERQFAMAGLAERMAGARARSVRQGRVRRRERGP